MKMFSSFRGRLFVFAGGIVVAVLTILLMVQSFLLSDFYHIRGVNNVKTAMESVVAEADKEGANVNRIYQQIGEISYRTGSYLELMPYFGESSVEALMVSPGLIVQLDNGQEVNVDVAGLDYGVTRAIAVGEPLQVEGVAIDASTVVATRINGETFEASSLMPAETLGTAEDLVPYEGESSTYMEDMDGDPTLVDSTGALLPLYPLDGADVVYDGVLVANLVEIPSTASTMDALGIADVYMALDSLAAEKGGLEQVFDEPEIYQDATIPMAGNTTTVLIRPMTIGEERYFLYSYVTLASTEEAVGIFREFYWLNYLIALLVAVVGVWWLSKGFTKPLQKMTLVAEKMAALDFSEQVEVTHEDEMGSLGSSLNSLSSSLKNTIDDLQTANGQLKSDLEFKEEQEQIRRDFTANISHELKTPLTIMKGTVEGVRDGIYTEPDHMTSILEEIEHMEGLVFDMLQIARAEAKGYELKRSQVALHGLINQTLERFDSQLINQDLRVNRIVEPLVASLDQALMSRVLENIMSNAIRHGLKGSTLTVRLAEGQGQAIIEVENQGTPIPEDQLTEIWKAFHRVDSSRNRRSGGTGLGLVIVRNIVEAHGGHCSARNTETGVCFQVAVPLMEATNVEARNEI